MVGFCYGRLWACCHIVSLTFWLLDLITAVPAACAVGMLCSVYAVEMLQQWQIHVLQVVVSESGVLGTHGWLPYDKTNTNFFTFDRDPLMHSPKWVTDRSHCICSQLLSHVCLCRWWSAHFSTIKIRISNFYYRYIPTMYVPPKSSVLLMCDPFVIAGFLVIFVNSCWC